VYARRYDWRLNFGLPDTSTLGVGPIESAPPVLKGWPFCAAICGVHEGKNTGGSSTRGVGFVLALLAPDCMSAPPSECIEFSRDPGTWRMRSGLYFFALW